MSDIHTEIVMEPSAWIGANLRNEPDWTYTFTPDELDELDTVLQQVKTRGLALNEIDREAFPLPTLSAKLSACLDEIRLGRGFVVLRGLPVQAYSDEDVGLLFWGLAAPHAESIPPGGFRESCAYIRPGPRHLTGQPMRSRVQPVRDESNRRLGARAPLHLAEVP